MDGAVDAVSGTRPVTTEGQVNDEPHVLEVIPWARVGCQAEEGEGDPPRRGIRQAREQVGRLRARGPEPRADVACQGPPFGCEGAATLGVEGHAHGVRRPGLGTALIWPLARGPNVAVVRLRLPGAPLPGPQEVFARSNGPLVAAVTRVERRLHAVRHVHTLDDVELPVVRPPVAWALAHHPERGPQPAARGHVVQGDDEEPGVVGRL
mmetsp:Transcript_90757/g.293757  ORF Transcript_90757/g.293757 Transcript_90757/m.293757 type:complete len:208 (-) Transcript_90757:302-925(-)